MCICAAATSHAPTAVLRTACFWISAANPQTPHPRHFHPLLQVASGAASPRRRRRASSSSSLPPSRQLSAEESAELADLAELRLADGAAVERVAGWLERLAAGAGEAAAAALAAGSGDLAAAAAAAAASTEAAQEELQEVLLPLVIGLRRMGRLPAVLRQHKEASVARLKDFLRWAIPMHLACQGVHVVIFTVCATSSCAEVLRPNAAGRSFTAVPCGCPRAAKSSRAACASWMERAPKATQSTC